jgi:hypothetical protein
LLRQLTGHGGWGWQALGVLRPNPGYSDECMTLGFMEVELAEGAEGGQGAVGASGDGQLGLGPAEGADGGVLEMHPYTPQDLESALERLEEPLDGRSVSAWFLAGLQGRWG